MDKRFYSNFFPCEELALEKLLAYFDLLKECDEEFLIPGSICNLMCVANDFPHLTSSKPYKSLKNETNRKIKLIEKLKDKALEEQGIDYRKNFVILEEIEMKQDLHSGSSKSYQASTRSIDKSFTHGTSKRRKQPKTTENNRKQQKTTENDRKGQKRTKKNRKQQKTTENNRKQQKGTEKNRKEQKRTENNRKQQKTTEKDRKGPKRTEKNRKEQKRSEKETQKNRKTIFRIK